MHPTDRIAASEDKWQKGGIIALTRCSCLAFNVDAKFLQNYYSFMSTYNGIFNFLKDVARYLASYVAM